MVASADYGASGIPQMWDGKEHPTLAGSLLGPRAEQAEAVIANTAALYGAAASGGLLPKPGPAPTAELPELTIHKDVTVSGRASAGAGAASAERATAATAAARGGTLTGVTRLHPDEIATGQRLSAQIGRPLRESEHVGAEFVDDLGRSYDAIGRPAASQFWNEAKFFKSIDSHLLKSNDFTAIDLTGFTAAQKAAVGRYIDALPAPLQSRVIRIGF